MVAAHICGSCRGVDLADLGIPSLAPAEPVHCFGRSDMPAAPGVLGGYRCSCPCRTWGQTDSPTRHSGSIAEVSE